MSDYIKREDAIKTLGGWKISGEMILATVPSADARKNIHAQKVIRGGERDGSTCWVECSHCCGTVDLQDMFCKHCGAVLEYEK